MKRKSIPDYYPRLKIFYVKESEESDKVVKPKESLQRAQPYSFKSALKKTYFDYCTECTVDGLKYLHEKRGKRERLFWLLFLLISLILCFTEIKTQYDRWQTAPVIVSFAESPFPISQIPFPAITICPEAKSIRNEKLNFERFYNHLKSFGNNTIGSPSWLTDDEFVKMRSLLHVCGNYLVQDMKFPDYPPINIQDEINQLVPPFEKNFVHCRFNHTVGDCAPHFDKIYTEEGVCYSFNALNASEIYREGTHQYEYFQKDDHIRERIDILDWDLAGGYNDPDDFDTYPKRVVSSGLNAGLIVGLEELEESLDPICSQPVQGFKLILHTPSNLPQVDREFIHIPYERDVLITVTPHFLYTTDNINKYSPEDRNCYYPEERPLQFFRFYTQINCEVECLTNFTLTVCGCVQFSMPRLPYTKVCGASNISCYNKAEDDFLLNEYTGLSNEHVRCNCLPGCYTLSYIPEMSQGILNRDKVSKSLGNSKIFGQFKGGNVVSRFRVHFKANEFMAWKRSELYGIIEFLSSCGGLFGLFIGISVLSIAEFFYHFTFRFYNNVQEMKRRQYIGN